MDGLATAEWRRILTHVYRNGAVLDSYEQSGRWMLDWRPEIVLRSGCYLTHDSGMLENFQRQRGGPALRPALEVWSYVQSLPEPGLALLTMGRRDCSFDAGLPVPEKLYRPGAGWLPIGEATITALNDQHAYLRYAGRELCVGDMLASGISHPCTTFDKWKFLPVVDDDYNVVDGVLTYF